MVSDKHKIIFVHITKCAGMSIEKHFFGKKALSGMRWNQAQWDDINKIYQRHATAYQIKKYYSTPEQWDNYVKFAVIRNPWDRMLSSYFHVKIRGKINISLNDFLKFNSEEFPPLYSPLFIPMYEYLHCPITNKLLVDYIIRFEDLDNELKILGRKENISLDKITKVNRTYLFRRGKHYREIYSSANRDRIAEVFKKDIETFGYEY